MGSVLPAFGNWVVRWRVLVCLGAIVLSVGLSWQARDLEFSSDYRIFFAPENPLLATHEALEQAYSSASTVVFVIQPDSGPQGEGIFSRRILGALQHLSDEAWRLPYVNRVDSLTNYDHSYARGDELVVRDLVAGDPAAYSVDDLAEIRRVARVDPLIAGRLVSTDGRTAAVVVNLQVPAETTDATLAVAAQARLIAAEMRAVYPELRIALTGTEMLNNAFVEASLDDIAHLYPVMIGLLALALVLALRSWSAALAALLVTVMAGGSTLGMAQMMGLKLDPVTAIAPIIILTVAVADSIHLLITMFDRERHGARRNAALIESIRLNFQPILLTSLTTGIGFLSLNFGDVPPFRALGNMAALGVGWAFFYALFFLPAFMALMPGRPPRPAAGWQRALGRVAAFTIARPGAIIAAFTLGTLVLVAFIPSLRINDNFVEYFDPRIPFRADTDFASDNLSGILSMEFSVESGAADGIHDPAYLSALESFTAWLEARPEVAHVESIVPIMKRLNRNMHGDDPAYYTLPPSRAAAAQYLLFSGFDLNHLITIDKSASRVSATLDNVASIAIQDLKQDAEAWISANGAPGMAATGTGATVLFAYITSTNVKRMLIGTGFALVLISFTLVVVFGSIRFGLMSLAPNLLPVIAGFGVWALMHDEIGLYAAFVTATALGLIVDFTVHFLSKYLRHRREAGAPPGAAIEYAFSMVGPALVLSALVLILGFLVLALSAFELTQNLGIFTALIIALALLTDFLLLPALLMISERSPADQHHD